MSACCRTRKRDEGPRTSAVRLLPRHRPAVAALLRCRRISNPAGQGGAPRLTPAWQGGITNPAQQDGPAPAGSPAAAGLSRHRRTASLPPHCVAAAGFPIRRVKAVPHDSPSQGKAGLQIPPQHHRFAVAGFPIRRAGAVPHHSARRGKAGLQIPPQQEVPASARQLPPRQENSRLRDYRRDGT